MISCCSMTASMLRTITHWTMFLLSLFGTHHLCYQLFWPLNRSQWCLASAVLGNGSDVLAQSGRSPPPPTGATFHRWTTGLSSQEYGLVLLKEELYRQLFLYGLLCACFRPTYNMYYTQSNNFKAMIGKKRTPVQSVLQMTYNELTKLVWQSTGTTLQCSTVPGHVWLQSRITLTPFRLHSSETE